jgi:hypothetical protein
MPPQQEAPIWHLEHGRLTVCTRLYRLQLDERIGGCIISLKNLANNRELLEGPANDLMVYRDSGGLWRMGHEFKGGTFREIGRASEHPASIEVVPAADGSLEIAVHTRLFDQHLIRRLRLQAEAWWIEMRVTGAAPKRTTITCSFPTVLRSEHLTMDVPGGVIQRPVHKLYHPTFWAGRTFVHFEGEPQPSAGLAVFFGGPACIAYANPGVLQWVALRNAPSERAYGFLPLPAHPASGVDADAHCFDYGIGITTEGDFRQNQVPQRAREVLQRHWLRALHGVQASLEETLFNTDSSEVMITAIKPAEHGWGLIVRLARLAERAVEICLTSPTRMIERAYLCDALERDQQPLKVLEGKVYLTVEKAIASVRLIGTDLAPG